MREFFRLNYRRSSLDKFSYEEVQDLKFLIDAALPKDKIVELLVDHPSGTADVQAASVFDRLRADLSKNGTEAANQASNSALGQQSISVF